MGRVWGSLEDYYIFHSGATIESLSLKKEKLHHKGSDGKREEDGEAGSGDSPGTVGALVQALVAGVAFIRGAHLFNFLFLLVPFMTQNASTSAKHISRDALLHALSGCTQELAPTRPTGRNAILDAGQCLLVVF